MSKSKEEIYDAQISPLMAQIIAICKEHKISTVATFSLTFSDEDESGLECTTVIIGPEYDSPPCHKEIVDRIYRGKSSPAFRITTKDKDGKTLVDEVVL